ncbi:MAG: hypothetical protein ABIV21_09145, partial [Pyrinomonadaceae bacterium]
PLLFPATPKECFEMMADAFDLAERLQTPVIMMTDLDLGMNDHITEPLVWDDSRPYDRGKVLTAEQLEYLGKQITAMQAAVDKRKLASNGKGSDHIDAGLASELDAQPLGDQSMTQPLEQFKGKWGRYLDIDDDGIPYRTIPGTHSTRGAFVTRGSSRDEYAVYTEDGEVYRRNMDRLLRKWDTAKELVPGPQFYRSADTPVLMSAEHSEEFQQKVNERGTVAGGTGDADKSVRAPLGVLFFGTSTFAAEEALEMLEADSIHLDAMRVRAFPFSKAVSDFVDSHERLFVIEQNRDAQFRTLMMIELATEAERLLSVLNYDGMPITADKIFRQIKECVDGSSVL